MDTKSEKFKTFRQHARRQLERDKSLIQQLREMRIQQGLSQDEVAFRMGITQPAVCAIEKGNSDPNLGTIRRMALAVDCQISYIVTPIEVESTSSIYVNPHSVESTYTAASRAHFSIDHTETNSFVSPGYGSSPELTTTTNSERVVTGI